MTELEPQPAVPKPRIRWFQPTPDRLLIVLLAVECLLWLSEWFQWFAFNTHKGWTVLIAVASVGAFLLLVLLWFVLALLFRRRFQFSIRSLLVMVVVVAVPCSWLAVEMKKAREQKSAVEAIRKLGKSVAYDYEFDRSGRYRWDAPPPGPAWLRNLLGDNFLTEALIVFLDDTEVTDADMERIKHLDRLQRLELQNTKITDTGLQHVKDFTQLGYLDLSSTQVTDAGMKNLKGLAKLWLFDLTGTQVTGAGLEHLKGLNELQVLMLSYTQVTDAGLEHLEGLIKLRDLNVTGTKVTDAGVKKLQQALPNCEITH